MNAVDRIDSIHRHQAVLFADLGESTRLYEQLGDQRAHELATACLRQLEAIVGEHTGTLVKHIGDEVMCTFPSPDLAVEAACAMQRSVAEPQGPQHLTLHVGLHWGPVLPDHGDVFGDAVNLAARMVGLARAGQILTTGATVDALLPETREQTRWIDHRAVKGKREPIEVFEVVWQEVGLTSVVTAAPTTLGPELVLRSESAEVRGDHRKSSITLGRAPANDIVLEGNEVSRFHARIEQRGEKWVLCDRSTNGTVVEPEREARVRVHREELLLPRAGRLGAYQEEPDDAPLPVRFELIPEAK